MLLDILERDIIISKLKHQKEYENLQTAPQVINICKKKSDSVFIPKLMESLIKTHSITDKKTVSCS